MRFYKGTRRPVRRVLIGLACVAVALVAVWPGVASGRAAAGAGVTSYPFTIDNCGQKVTFTKAPSRVLIMNG